MKNWKTALGALVLSISTFGAGAAFTTAAHAQPMPATTPFRGERGSARNIAYVRAHLERLIDELQRDQRDYDGHREQAIDLMQQARNQLILALQWDATHGH